MLRRIGALLDAELLKRVHRSLNPASTLVLFAGIGTVQIIRNLSAANAADSGSIEELRTNTIHISGSAQQHHTRRQSRQFIEPAAIQRQVHNLTIRHHMTQGTGFRIQQREIGVHFNHGTGFAQHQIYIQQQIFSHHHLHTLAHRRPEARGRHADIVDARV